ncbi:MAG TPA: hypothetical protein PK760_00065 [Flavobacteriales bacterium]|nr:hypothetical protein [Flavobacteriales bacterium]
MPAAKPSTNIESMDWRINNLTQLKSYIHPVSGQTIPADNAVTEAAILPLGKKTVCISVPNTTALFLNLSHTHRMLAEEGLARCTEHKDPHNKLPDEVAYELIQSVMASIVFACSALESFANEMTPDNYVHVVKKKDGHLHHDKDQIERWITLSDKLGEVLPKALGVKSPKGGRNWEACEKLIRLRDRIIHMKTADRKFAGPVGTQRTIWNNLIADPLPQTHSVAKAMMKSFLDAKGLKPRWFEKCPF